MNESMKNQKILKKIILDKPKIYPHLFPKGVPLCIVNSIEA